MVSLHPSGIRSSATAVDRSMARHTALTGVERTFPIRAVVGAIKNGSSWRAVGIGMRSRRVRVGRGAVTSEALGMQMFSIVRGLLPANSGELCLFGDR